MICLRNGSMVKNFRSALTFVLARTHQPSAACTDLSSTLDRTRDHLWLVYSGLAIDSCLRDELKRLTVVPRCVLLQKTGWTESSCVLYIFPIIRFMPSLISIISNYPRKQNHFSIGWGTENASVFFPKLTTTCQHRSPIYSNWSRHLFLCKTHFSQSILLSHWYVSVGMNNPILAYDDFIWWVLDNRNHLTAIAKTGVVP